jgi:hypothetical protein
MVMDMVAKNKLDKGNTHTSTRIIVQIQTKKSSTIIQQTAKTAVA